MFIFNNKKKRVKVVGKIVRFEIEDHQHYPVFSFKTQDNIYYELRNKPKNIGLKEASLEDVYIESGVLEKLQETLPIGNIVIKYLEEDPTDFIPRWI